MRTDTFAVPPCFTVLSREQPFWVQTHPCSITGVPDDSYFCSYEQRFTATAHKAVSACLQSWLAPSASSLLLKNPPTSLVQCLSVIALKQYPILRNSSSKPSVNSLDNLGNEVGSLFPMRDIEKGKIALGNMTMIACID